MTGVQTFRKKPVEIQAMQMPEEGSFPNRGQQQSAVRLVAEWMTASGYEASPDEDADGEYLDGAGRVLPEHGANYLEIETLEGTMTARPGDFIIRGVQGEFYPCKPDIFAATYDLVTHDPKVDALDGGRLG